LKNVILLYFSPTHTTQKTARAIAQGTGLPCEEYDCTLPTARQAAAVLPAFGPGTLAVIAAPVYGGRPAKFLCDVLQRCKGNGAPAILLVQYGNRHYDEALTRLASLAEAQGFVPAAAAAFVGEHSFSSQIAAGRPNAGDLAEALHFGAAAAKKCASDGWQPLAQNQIPGRPRDFAVIGSHISHFKDMGPVGPTVSDRCVRCGTCVAACPAGALTMTGDGVQVDGKLCIHCRACAKACPHQAIEITHPLFAEIVQNCREAFGQDFCRNTTAL